MKRFMKVGIGAAAAGAAALMLLNPYLDLSNPNSVLSALLAEGGPVLERGLAYGTHPRQRLDIYRPEAGGESGPVALFLYGGGWRRGKRSTYGFVGAALASKGITTVIPDYRLYPDAAFPAFVEDAAAAHAWTSGSIAKGKPVFLIGHSAGAHSAALIAYDRRFLDAVGADVPDPAGFIGLAGPYAFNPTTWETTREIFSRAKSADEARPVAHVMPGGPPSLLMHGLNDSVVKLWNARQLAEALARAGTPVRKLEPEGIGHIGLVLAIARPLRWRAPVLSEMVRFMKAARK